MISQPMIFHAKPPSVWELFFWASWIGLSLLSVGAWWSEPLETGRLLIAVAPTIVFAGFFFFTWQRRKRESKPALILLPEGLRFRPETPNERFVRWDELTKLIDDRNGSLVFVTNQILETRSWTMSRYPTGVYLPLSCQTREGVKLATCFPKLWQEVTAASDS